MIRMKSPRGRRLVVTGVMVVGGGALALGALAGGQPLLAAMLAVLIAGFAAITYRWSGGGGDVAALLRSSGDERQRMIDMRSTAFAGVATILFCLGGGVVDLARGGTGNPWTLICAVSGVAYALALGILRRRA